MVARRLERNHRSRIKNRNKPNQIKVPQVRDIPNQQHREHNDIQPQHIVQPIIWFGFREKMKIVKDHRHVIRQAKLVASNSAKNNKYLHKIQEHLPIFPVAEFKNCGVVVYLGF